MGVVWKFFSLVYLFSFFSHSFEDGPERKTNNQPNPVKNGMRTPVYSYYHIYSKVLDKNACRSIKGDLTTHSTILDSVLRRLLLYEICRTAFPLVVSQRKLVTLFSFFSIALSIIFKFHPALSLFAFCEQCSDHRSG